MRLVKAFLSTTMMIACMFVASSPVSAIPLPETDGYWTDGYWDGTNNVWVDGYWTETPETAWQEPSYQWYGGGSYVKVGNHYATLGEGMEQWIVDQPGTAAHFWWNGREVIADHAYQGFSAIRWADTAEVNGVTYKLASRYYGPRDTWHLYLPDGRDFTQCWDGSIIMYTCTGSGVTITYWNPAW